MKRIYIYKRFERFWHWTQALLIISLGITGFEVHGTIHVFGFERAVMLHNRLAWALIVLIAFAIFWHFTTGEWKQYIPTLEGAQAMVRYYLKGIFANEPHPVKKTELSKLNPLQRLTYAGLKLFVIPLQVVSGFLYLYYNQWNPNPILGNDVGRVALAHTFGAFLLFAFLIAHIYLTTTGHTVLSNIRAMITGWEEVEE